MYNNKFVIATVNIAILRTKEIVNITITIPHKYCSNLCCTNRNISYDGYTRDEDLKVGEMNETR